MNPRIDSVVMKPNGQQATVSGPINWDPDETSATFSAVIAQMDETDGATVLATGQNAKVYKRIINGQPGDQRWQADVQTVGGGRLELGEAEGWGIAAVLETGGRECYPWQVPDLEVTPEQPVVVNAPPH